MADTRDIVGNWYGMMVHYPSRGMINVSFSGKGGTFMGKWDCTGLTGGLGKRGTFNATLNANWLNILITSKPFAKTRCQLTIALEKGESMITGVLPLEGLAVPFATVTLFRHELPLNEMTGICPVLGMHPK